MSQPLIEESQNLSALLEDRFFPLFEFSTVGFAKIDPDRQWMRVNPKLCEITGYTERELLGMTCCAITHPDDLDALLSSLKGSKASNHSIQTLEKRCLCKNGSIAYVTFTATWVQPENGQPGYYIALIEEQSAPKDSNSPTPDTDPLHPQGSNDGIWSWDLLSDEVCWSDGVYDMLGLSRDTTSLDASWVWERVHPDDRDRAWAEIQTHLAQGSRHQLQFRMRHASGKYRYVLSRGEAVYHEQGTPIRLTGFYNDITERAKAEEALKESESRFRALAEQAPLMIWMTDEKGSNIYANQTWLNFIGYTPEENYGAGWSTAVHPDDSQAEYEVFMRAFSARSVYESEFRLRKHTGEYGWIIANGFPRYTPDGEFSGYIGICQDITERKLYEQAIQQSEERFSLVIDSSNDGLYDWDIVRDEPYWNDRYFEMLGYQPDEFKVSYEKYVALIHPDDRERVTEAIQGHLQQPGSYETVYRMRHKQGHYLNVICRGGTLFQDGKPVRLLGLVRDVSPEVQSRQALQQSEARLRRIVDSDIIGIVFWDRMPGGITDANEAFLQMVGYSREELLSGKINWRAMTPPEYHALDEAAFAQMDHHPKGKCEPYEKQYVGKDGHRIDILLAVAYDEGHKDSGVAFILDITERKQAERALKESEERFRGLADASPFMVWMTNPEGQINYHNKRTLEFTGLTLEETLQQRWLESVHPDDRDTFMQNFFLKLQQKVPYEDEFRGLRQDGEYRWLLTMGIPRFNTENQFLGYIGSTIDITDRKIAELEKQTSLEKERLLRRIMEIVSQSFLLDSVLDQIVKEVGQYFNADRCGLLRYNIENDELIVKLSRQYSSGFEPLDPDAIPFKSLGFLKHSILKSQEPDIINIASMEDFARESRDYFEKYGLDAECHIAAMETVFKRYSIKANLAIEIYYQGMPYGMIGLHQCTQNRRWTDENISLLRDIATHVGIAFSQSELFLQEQKARTELELHARKLELSNRELEQFATIASHDLQEPLRKVQIFSQMVAENCTPEGQDYIERMQSATTRMQSLISDLLMLSRITRKAHPFQTVHLNHCVENALEDLELLIQELTPNITVESLTEIEADGKQVEQLFLNLIGNALKFQPPGQIPKIRIHGSLLPDNRYEIVVQDNGIGFDPQYRERIFEPFERLNGNTGQYPGTGMGLAITRKIIERHGGSIQVHSKPGEGATFTLRLPIKQ